MRRFAAFCALVLTALFCAAGGQTASAQPNAEPAFVWTIQPLPAQRWDGRRALPLRIFVGPRKATGVQLMPPDVIEPTGLRPIGRTFLLCPTESGPCDRAARQLDPNRSHVLWIRPVGSGQAAAGTYAATFTLVAAERPQGDTVSTSLYVNRDDLRIVGALLVVLGVLIAFLVTRVMRQRADRNAMLRPAALLVDQLARLRSDRQKHDGTLQDVDAALRSVEEELALPNVRQYLPGTMDFFSAPASVPAAGETYQAFLTRIANQLGSLAIILTKGILVADRERAGASNQKMHDILDKTVAELDALARGTLPLPEAAATAVQEKLGAMQSALNAARGTPSDETPVPPAIGYSTEQLAFQSTVINLAGWAVFAMLSTLVGIYLLVLRDNDFGQTQDLLLCLLWGFGLPIAGQGLGGLTSGGIASSLGVTLTRPS